MRDYKVSYRYGYVPRRRRYKPRKWLVVSIVGLVFSASLLSICMASGGDGRQPSLAAAPEGPHSLSAESVPTAAAALAIPFIASDQFTAAASTPPPAVTGLAAAIVEEPCGALLYAMGGRQRFPPASLTKIATALVATERAVATTLVDIEVDGAALSLSTDSTVMGLKPGQRVSMLDLLYGLLLPSGNDAALAIAKHVGGTVPTFVEMMNRKVEQMGLRDTHFTNPHGLDEPRLYTSALDMVVLGRELLRRPQLAQIVGTRLYQPAWDGPPLWNGNLLLFTYPGALGIKTGYTDEAGGAIVAAAEREGRRLIIVIMKSADMYGDAVALFDWAFAHIPAHCPR